MQDLAPFLGAIVAVIAVSEAHLRVSANVGKAALLLCAVWLSGKPTAAPAAKRLKLWGAMAGIACLFAGRTHLFSATLLVNVLMIAVPPLYAGDLPLAAASLWLAALTPIGPLGRHVAYMWCHFAVLFTYYALSAVTREHAVALLVSVVPMLIGLLGHAGDPRAAAAAAVYRSIGMLVAFLLPDVWRICTSLPITRFSGGVDGSRCTRGSFADFVDSARNHRAFRYGCYAGCTALLILASIESRVENPPKVFSSA